MVLWDEEDKRGWLVNGTSASLHTVRWSLKNVVHGQFNSEFLRQPEYMQEIPGTHKVNSAIKVRLNRENLKLKVRVGNKDHLSFVDRVDGFCDIPEKIIDYRVSVDC